jgi:hypothetical protein
MFVPVILGSDKTTVSVGTGNNEYWPVYLSIGNIHNNVRRAHRNGVVLLGFLAIPKSARLILHFSLLMSTLRQLTRSMPMMGNSGNSAVNYSIHHWLACSSLSNLG